MTYLAELQPAFFCEVSPELAAERSLEHAGWATIITAPGAIEARVLVTERMRPLRIQGQVVHQVGPPLALGPERADHRGRGQSLLSLFAADTIASFRRARLRLLPGINPAPAHPHQITPDFPPAG